MGNRNGLLGVTRLVKSQPRGVQSITPRMREAYKLRFDQDWSSRKIAEHFSVTIKTVTSWLRWVHDALIDERNRGMVRQG